jgi:hypothetical protein
VLKLKMKENKLIEILEHTIALIPPEDTNDAAASLDCITAPSKSGGKQLKQKSKKLAKNL